LQLWVGAIHRGDLVSHELRRDRLCGDREHASERKGICKIRTAFKASSAGWLARRCCGWGARTAPLHRWDGYTDRTLPVWSPQHRSRRRSVRAAHSVAPGRRRCRRSGHGQRRSLAIAFVRRSTGSAAGRRRRRCRVRVCRCHSRWSNRRGGAGTGFGQQPCERRPRPRSYRRTNASSTLPRG